MYVMNGIFVHIVHTLCSVCQFSPFEIRPECTAKWLLFRHQNYREVFVFAHIVPYHLHPSIHRVMGQNRCSNEKQTLKFVPRFWLLLSIAHGMLVAHMACSNKIMKFHTGGIEIEKSLFKTFMYAHRTHW